MPRHYSVRQPVFVIGPSIAYIPLTQGLFAVVDVDDAADCGQWNWCAAKQTTPDKFYAVREVLRADGARRLISMHGYLLGLTGRAHVADHVNTYASLDNRRANIRPASVSQQGQNRRVSRSNKSGCKGVLWIPRISRWRAQIKVGSKRLYLGHFVSKQDAHSAYSKAAAKHFGVFARSA